MELFEPSKRKVVLFVILLIVGIGLGTGPYAVYIPPTPGHEITWGMFGIVFGATSFLVANMIIYAAWIVTVISLIFLIGFFIKGQRSNHS